VSTEVDILNVQIYDVYQPDIQSLSLEGLRKKFQP